MPDCDRSQDSALLTAMSEEADLPNELVDNVDTKFFERMEDGMTCNATLTDILSKRLTYEY